MPDRALLAPHAELIKVIAARLQIAYFDVH